MRRLLRRLLYWIIPELRLLRDNNYDFSKLLRYKDQYDESKHIYIYAPFSLNETNIGNYTYISKNLKEIPIAEKPDEDNTISYIAKYEDTD